MSEPMKVEITLPADVVERLQNDEHTIIEGSTIALGHTCYESPEEYRAVQRGETLLRSLDDFVAEKLRQRLTVAEVVEGNYRTMVRSGASLGLPGYKELWDEIIEQDK